MHLLLRTMLLRGDDLIVIDLWDIRGQTMEINIFIWQMRKLRHREENKLFQHKLWTKSGQKSNFLKLSPSVSFYCITSHLTLYHEHIIGCFLWERKVLGELERHKRKLNQQDRGGRNAEKNRETHGNAYSEALLAWVQ